MSRPDGRGAVVVIAALLCVAALAGCSSEPAFAVGDCVRVEQQVLDHDMEPADCAEAAGTFDANARIYKVDEVLADMSATCTPGGFFPIQFAHEPDGVIYCLSMATG